MRTGFLTGHTFLLPPLTVFLTTLELNLHRVGECLGRHTIDERVLGTTILIDPIVIGGRSIEFELIKKRGDATDMFLMDRDIWVSSKRLAVG